MKEDVNYLRDIKQKVKQYAQMRILLFRLQATEKISQIASTVITVAVSALIGFFLLVFGSITAGYWLADITGSLTAGFGIVALFYLIVFLFILFFLRKILQNFFINKIIQLLHKKD